MTPSIARGTGGLNAEITTIKRFQQSAAPYVAQRPRHDDWEWIFLMQHYRAPTRLLDWSESPLCALYFALAEPAHDTVSGAIWCLDPVQLNRVAGHTRAYERDILAFGVDKQLEDYLPDRVNERLARLNPIAAIGPRNSTRMVAQLGVFTVMHADPTPIEAVGDQSHVWRFVIPADAKVPMREELRLLGVSEHTFFPEMDRVASVVKSMTT